MINERQLFTQFGGGREGWWGRPEWLTVLEVLGKHEGEPYSQERNPALFAELEEALAPVNASLSPRGEDESRSVFRASRTAWADTGVVDFEDGSIALTADGRAVLAGERSYDDCLVHLFTHYVENRNGKSPFIPILELLAGGEATFDRVFEAVQSECGPEMAAWMSAPSLRGFPFAISPNPANPTRSVRLVLRLLGEVGIVEVAGDKYRIANAVLADDIRKEWRKLHESTGLPQPIADLDVLRLTHDIQAAGWQFAPWQVATYCYSVQTKPFVILAGVSGTGKTKLPRLVAEATGAIHRLIPVRPDWRDSSDLLGFVDLAGRFHPGPLLVLARDAMINPGQQFFAVLDEMNLARVEYYLAEILSLIEERKPDPLYGFRTEALISRSLPIGDEDQPGGFGWHDVFLPANLALVGSVNMDETTHAFSRKVLDRAFVIEFSEISLDQVQSLAGGIIPGPIVGSEAWRPKALRLSEHPGKNEDVVVQVIQELKALNAILTPSQLQVGYRVRDEVAMFALTAMDSPAMLTTDGDLVDSVDLALCMKVLPRVQGGGAAAKGLLMGLRDWAGPAEDPRLPVCSERISILEARLQADGFTSFWL